MHIHVEVKCIFSVIYRYEDLRLARCLAALGILIRAEDIAGKDYPFLQQLINIKKRFIFQRTIGIGLD